MNAGTAHKAALGLLSSLTMTRLGHVYDGLMVSMRPQNAKLRQRAAEIVVEVTGCSAQSAAEAVNDCGGRIKEAALVARGVPQSEAAKLLASAGGNLRTALARIAALKP
jgi:N-acetylmuramic acid 6-phosphate etherase